MRLTNVNRTVLMSVVGTALFAWAVRGAVRDREGDRESVSMPPPNRQRVEPAARIEPLHDWLRPEVAPLHATRNPFAFKTAPQHVVATRKEGVEPESATTQPLPKPAFRLEGVAEDAGPDGAVRTAIISGQDHLFLVKQGEEVTSRYRVVSISPDTVVLVDVSDGSSVGFTMK